MRYIEFEAGLKLIRVGSKLNQLRNNALKKYGITASLVDTIFLFEENGGLTISDLKDELQVSHQAAQKNVEKLKEKGYVYTAPSPTDARANVVFLTEEGHAKCLELKQGGSAGSSDLFSTFTEQEKEQLIELIEKLSRNI